MCKKNTDTRIHEAKKNTFGFADCLFIDWGRSINRHLINSDAVAIDYIMSLNESTTNTI